MWGAYRKASGPPKEADGEGVLRSSLGDETNLDGPDKAAGIVKFVFPPRLKEKRQVKVEGKVLWGRSKDRTLDKRTDPPEAVRRGRSSVFVGVVQESTLLVARFPKKSRPHFTTKQQKNRKAKLSSLPHKLNYGVHKIVFK